MADKKDEPTLDKVTVTPSFLLRGVDLKEILSNYSNGKYTQLYPSGKLNSKVTLTFHPLSGGTQEDETYIYRHKSEYSTTYTTTNHQVYIAYKKGTLGVEPQICNWCRQSFTGDPVGIPIRMEEYKTGIYVFYVDDPHYHTYECALASLSRSIGVTGREPLYLNSEQFLRLAHRLQYPNRSQLSRAPDWRLHKGNGGPLPTEEFDSNSSTYYRTTQVIFAPVKIEYLVTPNLK